MHKRISALFVTCLTCWLSTSAAQDVDVLRVTLPVEANATVFEYSQSHVMLRGEPLVEIEAFSSGEVIIQISELRKDAGTYRLTLSPEELQELVGNVVSAGLTNQNANPAASASTRGSNYRQVMTDPTITRYRAHASSFALANGESVRTTAPIELTAKNASSSSAAGQNERAIRIRNLESRVTALVEEAKAGRR